MLDATPQATSPAPTAVDTPVANSQIGDGENGGENGGDNGQEDQEMPEVPAMEPPQKQNKKAMRKRLYRIMQPKADGTLKVPQAIIDEYKDDASKWKVFRLFEKTGYQPDWGLKKTTCC